MCFGLAATQERLLEYARERQFLKPKAVRAVQVVGIMDAVSDLGLRAGLRMLVHHDIIHVRYNFCLALYNNRTQHLFKYSEERQQKALDFIRKELAIPEDEQPKWYHQYYNDVD